MIVVAIDDGAIAVVVLAIFVVSLVAFAIVVLVRAQMAESRERLGRCVRCGYDMRSTPGRCPECGTERPSSRAERRRAARASGRPWKPLGRTPPVTGPIPDVTTGSALRELARDFGESTTPRRRVGLVLPVFTTAITVLFAGLLLETTVLRFGRTAVVAAQVTETGVGRRGPFVRYRFRTDVSSPWYTHGTWPISQDVKAGISWAEWNKARGAGKVDVLYVRAFPTINGVAYDVAGEFKVGAVVVAALLLCTVWTWWLWGSDRRVR